MKKIYMLLAFNKANLFLLFLCFHLSSQAQTNSNYPNILFIIADDLGIDATNGYQQNSLMPVTPVLDSLRATGLTFKNAWAAPKCTPTRAAIMSGKYGVKTGVTKTPGNLDTSHVSLFKEIAKASNAIYSNAVIGKWHISHPFDFDHPGDHGVDYFSGSFPSQVDSYTQWKRVENGTETDESIYATKYFTDAASNWINQQNQPWLMWLAHVTPHSPFHEPPAGTYSISSTNNNKQKYIAMIENMDYEIGRLLHSIPSDVRNNTVIIFLGDNGSPNGVLQYYPNGHGKASLYQGGVNVPLIISGKGVTRMNEEEDALVHATDLHATILELTGSSLPGGIHNSLSFEHLLGSPTGIKRTYNYSELDDDWTIRNDQYKLIEYANGTQEFYDLINDPKEEQNLIDTLSSQQQAIKAELENEAEEIRNGWSCNDGIQNGNETSIDDCGAIEVCANDNSTSVSNIGCCTSPAVPSSYVETINLDKRLISTNNFPDHDYCFGAAHTPAPQYYDFQMDATPSYSGTPRSVLSGNNRPDYYFGVALNGVLMAPAPATPFIFENPNTGEYNWNWVFEPTNNQGSGQGKVSLDCASAHTGPQGYHYHGNMFQYAEKLLQGITLTDMSPVEPLQVGWASDGFPIIYRFGPDVNGNMKQLLPAWQIKQGNRPGDGITAPCDSYNGKYTNDYEFVASIGDLDECNGIRQNITLNTNSGPQTFEYFYVITNDFPQVPRCVMGFRDESFNNSNKGSTTSVLDTQSESFQLKLRPNPVRESTTLQFTPPHSGDYQLRIFTLSGNEVMRFTQSISHAGHTLNLNLELKELPAGLYMVQLQSADAIATRKLLKL